MMKHFLLPTLHFALCSLALCLLSACTPHDEPDVKPGQDTTHTTVDTTHVDTTEVWTPREDIAPLTNPNATPEARLVYDFLRSRYERRIISGAMACVNWNTNEAQWVHYHTGRWPALTCFDLIQCTMPEDWAQKTYASYDCYQDWWDNHGIVAGMWHEMVPKDMSAEFNSKNATYKPTETTFKASQAVISGTPENEWLLADLDKAAVYLKEFQDRGIPVIWRPYHEAAGKWFWWGESAESHKALWHIMYDRFVNYHHLNNLIWVWTTQSSDDAWYPGDEYVDIIGCDIYQKASGSSFASFFEYHKMRFPGKMVTLSECGKAGYWMASLQDQWNSGAKFSYFMPWYDQKRTQTPYEYSIKFTDTVAVHEQCDLEWWRAAWQEPYILSREDMPDWKE